MNGAHTGRRAAPDVAAPDEFATDEFATDEFARDDVAHDGIPPDEPARGELWRTVVRTMGEVLVTSGLIVLLFVVYELFVTDFLNGRVQEDLNREVHAEWEADPPVLGSQIPGDAFAVLHIPRLGADYQRVVLEGTAYADLKDGPGHYTESALPGEVGNVAIAGHRTTYGSPFRDLDRVQPGDPIVVETADSWFVYRVLGDPATGDYTGDPSGIPGQQIVVPTDVQVINPTPNAAADAPATGSYLTLTTCHPRFSARERLIVHAVLDGAGMSKADLPAGPPALTEG
ncbi:MAG: class sortase [Blastococcus sp.]|nr:class sortase [Blastococcus sp.]